MTLTRLRARAVALAIAVVAAVPLITAMTPSVAAPANVAAPAAAAATATFNPGNIISDAVFFNGNAMTEAQVDAFLRSRVTYCVPGYTCLKDFRANTWTRGADAQCSTYTGGTNESSARIIVKVAQACGVNPQALIVMLQKEQGLVASQAPSSWAWQASMGYACPDTAPCAAEYFGFYNQVYMAAWQLKRYGNSSYFNWFPVGGVANVRYHPDAACGSSPVYIANRATAALYYYTPYQPNAAALAAGYGTSPDYCSSYGNRNFFNYFRDWFGDPSGSAIAQIDALYAQASWLGRPTGSHNPIAGGYVRGYELGAITWSANTGAVIISNTFRDRYATAGGVTGVLGWPARDAIRLGTRAWAQEFLGGTLSQTPSSSVVVVGRDDWRAYQDALGGHDGLLGLPTGEPACVSGTCRQTFEGATMVSQGSSRGFEVAAITAYATSSKGSALGTSAGLASLRTGTPSGFVQGFANGAVVTSSAGTFSVTGAIRSVYGEVGGLSGAFGWPSGDATCTAGNCRQSFAGGRIESIGSATPIAISARIAAVYDAAGGATGTLGAPVSSTTVRSDGGHVQGFANGAITWTSSTGGFAVIEPLRSAFATQGGLTGALGWPTSNQSTVAAHGGGHVQGFVGGALTVTSSGSYVVTGPIRTSFNARGGLTGDFGWPTGNELAIAANGGGTVQGFVGGALVHRASIGVVAVTGAIRERLATAGGIAGSVGWPTTEARSVVAPTGTGTVQGFEGGAIVLRDSTGALLISGAVRVAFNAAGGLTGSLGWPTSELICASDGSCLQEFEGGEISVTAAGVATVRLLAV